MLVGHLGAGLAAKAIEPKRNLGTLFAAAMLLDAVLWLLVLLGLEGVTVPADYAARHYLYFNFSYSHSLLAALLWSVLAAVVFAFFTRDGQFTNRLFSRGAIVIALVVFSHWLLDFLVHPRELPLTAGGPTLGLGLWDVWPLGLSVELAVAVIGLALYMPRSGLAPVRRWTVLGTVIAAGLLTVWGAVSPAPPPAIPVLAVISLAIIALLVGLAAWADRRGTGGLTPSKSPAV